MRRVYVAIGIAAYLFCGWIAAGIWIADFWHSYPTLNSRASCRRYQAKAVPFVLGGPIAVAIGFFNTGFAQHGLMWRCPEGYR